MAAGPGPALAALDLLVRRGARKGGFELRVEALDLLAGGVLAVLGPNGAGKSTLLRTLAGLEVPLRGRIERRVAGPVTMVFQRPIAFSGSVEHNVATALSGLRLARAQRRQRAAEALEHFDIARLAWPRAARRRSRAASCGGSPWRAPSRYARRCCSSTSPSTTSTRPARRRFLSICAAPSRIRTQRSPS
jgi:ATPase subunit of ABC transporter with duplicated ATPase domains